jgi:succinate dehydrogenase/fumarate reductase flavoprotein subunit
MAGLVTALSAQELGARVLLLEKGDSPGGSLALSGGTLWCARTFDDLRRLVPHGDRELGRTLVDDFMPGVEWLRKRADLELLPSNPDRVVFLMKPDPRAFVARMLSGFTAGGGELRASTAGVRLLTEPSGGISGIVCGDAGGLRTISAKSVVLASGGFQANPEMRARYFGPYSDRLVLRSNPRSTGDGWTMALGVGAAESRGMASFYGHLLPAPPAVVPVNDFIAYTQYHSDQSVLLNLRGERFTDESRGDETSSQATARQPEALAVLVFDERVYRASAVRPAGGGSRACDTFQESKALGARAATAPTLAALAEEMDGWGVCGRAALATLVGFNEAAARGTAAHLAIPRREKADGLIQPPFYALMVTPGITFTLGGLRIDPDGRVLHRGGWPIPGLYAAGADAGGIHNEQYAGGLCLGLVFGRRAARHAVRRARG